MKKRLLSALLALVMVLALLPANVFAENVPETNMVENTPETPVTTPVTEEVKGDEVEDDEQQPEGPVSDPVKGPARIPAAQSDPAADGSMDGMTAKYIERNAEEKTNAKGEVTSTAITEAPGYYVVDTTTTKGQTAYYKIGSGYVVGGKYYANAVPKVNPTNVIVVGAPSGTIDAGTSTSLTVDLYGTGASITVDGSNLATLNVTDSYYTKEVRPQGSTRNTVNLSGMSTWGTQKSFTLNLTNVTVTSEINISGGYTHTVKLDNADATGGITLNGIANDKSGKAQNAAQTVTVNAENATVYRGSELGDITVSGNNSKVTLVDVYGAADAPNVSMTGTGTSLTVGGNSVIGDVTIMDNNVAATGTYSTITVNRGTVGNLTDNGTKATGAVNVTVNGGQLGNVNLKRAVGTSPKPVIKVNSATIGNVTVDNNKDALKVSGTYANVGNVILSGTAGFTLTGSNHTVGAITAVGTSTLSIPPDPTNNLKVGDLSAYAGHGIAGGTWDESVPKPALNSTLVYELMVGNNVGADPNNNPGTHTYYNADQLNQALVTQYEKAGSDGTGAGSFLFRVGANLGAAGYLMQFKNGKTLWGTMWIEGTIDTPIKLPTTMNTVTVTRWADKNRSWPAGSTYSAPTTAVVGTDAAGKTKVWELNASGGVTSGDITKITDVSVKGTWDSNLGGDVKATLNGTVITLSGAVPTVDCTMTLYLTTDAVEQKKAADGSAIDEDVPVTLPVSVTYFNSTKTLIFSNVANDDLTHGATLETDASGVGVLRLSNGTKYTLNGSGLKERSDKIQVVSTKNGDDDYFDHNFIEVAVNVSTLKTQADKQAVIDLLNGSQAVYDWSGSPAIREAVNAALATITDSQVDSWIAAAKKAAWLKVNTGTYDVNKGEETGYDTPVLVPYLQVNVTAYNPNGTLTATLVPSWRVEIRQGTPTGDRYQTAFVDPKNPGKNPESTYIAKAGSALSLGTNVSEITAQTFDELNKGVLVNFASDNAQLFSALPGTPDVYMHQDSTYAYKQVTGGTGDGFLIRHSGGTSLGTVTINTTAPLVTLYGKADNAGNRSVVAYYDTLQAAANDAQDQQHINVDQNYKGSMNISVTGYARKFTIQANGNNVVIANASGGLVDLNNTGSLYTVQLNRDNTAVVDGTTATIAVATVTNGSASVSATTAKSGTTITVTCTPAVGYRTNTVTASAHMTTNNTNVAVTMTKVSDNVYSFKVPEGADKITVTPAFVVGTAATYLPFTDVATNHWAYNSVKYVYDNGLMNGVNTAGTQFGGTQTLTRAMVVTILYRAAGSPYAGTNSFSDVPSNQWYSQAVAWASQNNVVNGYANGTFQPNWAITRQELATILYRYNTNYKGRATTGSTTLTAFPDQNRVDDWATAGMQWAVGNGIVNGITNGSTTTLSPAGSATRYEAATMLMRYGQGMGL